MAIDKNKIAAPIAITDPYNLLGIYPSNGIWAVADSFEQPIDAMDRFLAEYRKRGTYQQMESS